MQSRDVVGYIVEEMLDKSSLDESTIIMAGRLAEEDEIMYNLMNSWMKQTDKQDRLYIDDEIATRLENKNLL